MGIRQYFRQAPSVTATKAILLVDDGALIIDVRRTAGRPPADHLLHRRPSVSRSRQYGSRVRLRGQEHDEGDSLTGVPGRAHS